MLYSEAVIWFQLQHSLQGRRRFFGTAKTGISLCQAAHYDDVVKTRFQLSRRDLDDFQRGFVGGSRVAKLSIRSGEKYPAVFVVRLELRRPAVMFPRTLHVA